MIIDKKWERTGMAMTVQKQLMVFITAGIVLVVYSVKNIIIAYLMKGHFVDHVRRCKNPCP
jgi:hypothetical protein